MVGSDCLIGPREGSPAVAFPPPLAPAKAFSRSGCDRIFPFFSGVMWGKLSTGPCVTRPGSVLQEPIFSKADDCPRFELQPLVYGLNCAFRPIRSAVPTASGQSFGVSGHLRIVAAQARFLMSGSEFAVNVLGGLTGSAQGVAVELEAICAVNQSIEKGIGKGRFVDDVVAGGDGQLAGDQDRALAVAVLDDFHQVAALTGGQAVRDPSRPG